MMCREHGFLVKLLNARYILASALDSYDCSLNNYETRFGY